MVEPGKPDPLPAQSSQPTIAQLAVGVDGAHGEQRPQLTQEPATAASRLLEELSRRAFAAWSEARQRAPDRVVNPSVPILYFGDVEAYRASPLRVVTVGLNPSLAEFPVGRAFARFRAAEGLGSVASADDQARYLKALGGYFGPRPEHDPYDKWFRAYDDVLRGLGASYYAGLLSTAVHTDICSPVATMPPWSRLDRRTRTTLLRSGPALWHELVRFLRPDLLLASIGRNYLDLIRFQRVGPWRELCRIERGNPYLVRGRQLTLGDQNKAWLVTGRAAQTPFGTVSRPDKRLIGSVVNEFLDA
jgi:hypothetical protein